jgi:hypothetical protein
MDVNSNGDGKESKDQGKAIRFRYNGAKERFVRQQQCNSLFDLMTQKNGMQEILGDSLGLANSSNFFST